MKIYEINSIIVAFIGDIGLVIFLSFFFLCFIVIELNWNPDKLKKFKWHIVENPLYLNNGHYLIFETKDTHRASKNLELIQSIHLQLLKHLTND